MYNFFNFNVKFFHAAGWLYFQKPEFRNLWTKTIWYFYKIVGDVAIFLNTLSVVIESFLVFNHLGELFTTLMAITYNVGYYIRFYLYQTRKKEIMEVYNSVNDFFNENNKNHAEFFKMSQKYQKIIKIFSIAKSGIELTGSIGLCQILAIQGLYGHLRLPTYAWYPFPQDTQPNSFLICQFQNIAFGILVIRATASDCFFCMVIFFLGVQLKVLQNEFPQVLKSDPLVSEEQRWGEVRKWIKRHDDTLRYSKAKKGSVRLLMENNHYLLSYNQTLALLHFKFPNAVLPFTYSGLGTYDGYGLKMTIETFKSVISPFLANTYLVVLLLVLLCGVVTTSTESWTVSHKVTLISVGLLNQLIFFITCKAGDFLMDTQSSVPDEGYTHHLLLSPKKYSTAYKIIHIKCQKLIELTAYGFHPLSSHTFSVLLRATFSYYLAIIQISQRSRSKDAEI